MKYTREVLGVHVVTDLIPICEFEILHFIVVSVCILYVFPYCGTFIYLI